MQWCDGDANFTVVGNGDQFYLCVASHSPELAHTIMRPGPVVSLPHAPQPVANRLKSRVNQNTMAKTSTSSVTAAAVPALPALPATYEAALQELESLAAGLESGQLPLDQLLSGYQRGAQLLAFCKSKLEAVETQIKVLEGTELKPWA